MFSGQIPKRFRSFAFYIGMGYLVVYVLCTGSMYFLSSRVITSTTRKFDRQDVRAESEELEELLEKNPAGNWLAEQVTTGKYPPSTIFFVRIVNPRGEVEYTITWPTKIKLPEWGTAYQIEKFHLKGESFSEHYIPALQRRIQVKSTQLKDGRVLQVGKGSFLEVNQKKMMARMLLIFMILSTIFSTISSVFMLVITLRPLRNITASMAHIIDTAAFETGAPQIPSRISELNTLGRLFAVMTDKYSQLIHAMRQTMDNLAHDFRTPLTRIRGAAEIALKESELQPQTAEVLADIMDDCDRVTLQLQNILDTREIDSGFVKMNMKPLDLKKLVTEIIDMYIFVAEDKNITIDIAPTTELLELEGDYQRLARVFANIIDNAVKYTPVNGKINITFTLTPDTITTTIQDNGIGIPKNEQALIWQHLFRGEKARESEKGLGLGLNIVHIIITAHKGIVNMESELGMGTRFDITLKRHHHNNDNTFTTT